MCLSNFALMFDISSLMSSTGVIHGRPAQYLDYQDFMFIACVVVLMLAIDFLLPSYVPACKTS